MNEYNNGKICLWLDQGIGACGLNGGTCGCPFSKKGCEIQCKEIFKEEPTDLNSNRYTPNNSKYSNRILTKAGIFKRIGLRKGMAIAEWFIPYYEIDMTAVSPLVYIKDGIDRVKEKLKKSNYNVNRIRIYHNVEIAEVIGIYILGVDIYADQ